MTDCDLRQKKLSTYCAKMPLERQVNVSGKLHPKNQPSVPCSTFTSCSDHIQQTKKKKPNSKESRQDVAINYFQAGKTSSKIITNKQPRVSYSKNQQEPKIHKEIIQARSTFQTHHIKKCNKIVQKQNREPKSNIQEPKIIYQHHKVIKTEVIFHVHNEIHKQVRPQNSLKCPEVISHNPNTLKKSTKPFRPKRDADLVPKSGIDNIIQLALEQRIVKKNTKSNSELISLFEKEVAKINSSAETFALQKAFQKQRQYCFLPCFDEHLEYNHPEIDWIKRAITLNWMIQTLSELKSKRQVFGLAANYFDRFLASTSNFPLKNLQIMACAAISLANKMQGMSFNTSSLCMDGKLSSENILKYQQQLPIILKWKLNPPTANMWANRISQHWDMYLSQIPQKQLPQIVLNSQQKIYFRSQNNYGYQNYRTLMQYIDLSILDVHSTRYSNRGLAASFIYLILNVKLNLYKKEHIVSHFPSSSLYLVEDSEFNRFYCDFLNSSFAFKLIELLPTVQFCSTFMSLPLNFDLPAGINEQVEIQFSELCSLLNWNPQNMHTIKQRNRQYD